MLRVFQNKPFLVWLGGFYGLLAGLTIAMAAQITFLKFSLGPIKSVTLIVLAGGFGCRILFGQQTPFS